MPRLILAPRAVADLTEISTILAEAAGRSVANDYLLRVAVVRPYVVIYRTSASDVMVMRVLHGRRKITRRLVTERTH